MVRWQCITFKEVKIVNIEKGNTPEGIYWRLDQIYQMCKEINFPIRGCGNCTSGIVNHEFHTKCLINEKTRDQEWNPVYFCKQWKRDMRVVAILRKGE